MKKSFIKLAPQVFEILFLCIFHNGLIDFLNINCLHFHIFQVENT